MIHSAMASGGWFPAAARERTSGLEDAPSAATASVPREARRHRTETPTKGCETRIVTRGETRIVTRCEMRIVRDERIVTRGETRIVK